MRPLLNLEDYICSELAELRLQLPFPNHLDIQYDFPGRMPVLGLYPSVSTSQLSHWFELDLNSAEKGFETIGIR